jgi:hypothetical protein
MALLDRIFRDDPPPEEVDAQAQDSPIPAEPESDPEDDRALSPEYQEIKSRVHNQLSSWRIRRGRANARRAWR